MGRVVRTHFRMTSEIDNAIETINRIANPTQFGTKKLLNFTAVSLPDAGGWVAFAVLGIVAFIVLSELKRGRAAGALRSIAFAGPDRIEKSSGSLACCRPPTRANSRRV